MLDGVLTKTQEANGEGTVTTKTCYHRTVVGGRAPEETESKPLDAPIQEAGSNPASAQVGNFKEKMKKPKRRILKGNWGYAVVYPDKIYIPAFMCRLRPLLDALYKKTGIKKMIFTAILNADNLRPHLKNIKREWNEWFEEAQDYSHCIEIEYIPTPNQ